MRKQRKRWTRLLRGFMILLGLVILLGGVGAFYQSRASAADRVRFTPPGELVMVEGRQMHIWCEGEGNPTVVLDAGQGGWSTDWSDLMSPLSETTRVCAYDRAGYGWSEPAGHAPGPQAIADDLAALLDAGGIEAPYVLVGFSYTGLSSRLFAARHPDEVVGMVLVDPATEFDNEIMGNDLQRQQQSTLGVFQMFEGAARVGLVRLLDPREIAPYAPFIPENAAHPEVYYSFISEPRWWRTSRAEFAARLSDATLEHVKDKGKIADIPLIVIGAERIGGVDDGLETYAAAHLGRIRELAGRSTQGEFVLAENSSHEVARDRPDVVVNAVRRVVSRSREGW